MTWGSLEVAQGHSHIFPPFFDKLFHAAHQFDSFFEHGVRLAVFDGDQIGKACRLNLRVSAIFISCLLCVD